jgi:hypothetical protein
MVFDMRLVVPKDFDTRAPARRLPVLFKVQVMTVSSCAHQVTPFQVYGGPGSILVKKSFRLQFDEWVASKGFAVVSVDGRGTGGRGHGWSRLTYRRMTQH